jgi:hypothetical protein
MAFKSANNDSIAANMLNKGINKDRKRKSTTAQPQTRSQGPAHMVKADARKVGFSDLPATARALIHSYSLTTEKPNRCVAALSATSKNINAYILLTCRAIAREAKPVLYGQNTFRIDLVNIPGSPYRANHDEIERLNIAPFQEFMARIGQKNLSMIKNLVLAFHRAEFSREDEYSSLALPEEASLVVEVKLVSKKPFCEIKDLYPKRTPRLRKPIMADFKQGLLTHGMLSDWRLAPLSKVDAVEMCREYFNACTKNSADQKV